MIATGICLWKEHNSSPNPNSNPNSDPKCNLNPNSDPNLNPNRNPTPTWNPNLITLTQTLSVNHRHRIRSAVWTLNISPNRISD